ncbi:MAG: hypothetical protein JJU29_08135 [Verrucomicrobia bacterium]|nr:hypothetical protein [Verrucomicrobiota bacterium]MCH8511866.1 hypothetical protein [Kiritimatiellia bacterium]
MKTKIYLSDAARKELKTKTFPKEEDIRWKILRAVFIALSILYYVFWLVITPWVGFRNALPFYTLPTVAIPLFLGQMESGKAVFWYSLPVILYWMYAPELIVNDVSLYLVCGLWAILMLQVIRSAVPVWMEETMGWRLICAGGLLFINLLFLDRVFFSF